MEQTESLQHEAIVFELAEQKRAIQTLHNQSEQLAASLDKLTERFNAMGKFIAEGNKTLTNKLEEATKSNMPRYIVNPTRSEKTGSIALAMCKAKKEFGAVVKSGTTNRGEFSSINDMLKACLPIMEKHEIDASFLLGKNEYGEYTLTMLVTHSSDQWLETSVILNNDLLKNIEFPKNIGAAEKHMRRYMFRAMFNLAEEE